jgi:hypothetical protein
MALGTETLISYLKSNTTGEAYRLIQDIINVPFPYETKLIYS